MLHLSMVAALSAVYLLSIVQGQMEQQTIRVHQAVSKGLFSLYDQISLVKGVFKLYLLYRN